MSQSCHSYLNCCLYFTANSLSRTITEMAKEEFSTVGIDPSYAHLLSLLCEKPGLSQNELADALNLKPSTITRFLDKLQQKGLIERITKGRSSLIFPSQTGLEKGEEARKALSNLFERYCKVLGKDFAVKLTADIDKATLALEK
ncbi:MAG: MarR family transcriptional regulator [Muribaculaceae bacterium]|jgi:DNA-binding MarR family transcriptional regulator|nr:MarR family transcriptional regulator [Muribaculaceae bacterium]